jgi:hypothetical protein
LQQARSRGRQEAAEQKPFNVLLEERCARKLKLSGSAAYIKLTCLPAVRFEGETETGN